MSTCGVPTGPVRLSLRDVYSLFIILAVFGLLALLLVAVARCVPVRLRPPQLHPSVQDLELGLTRDPSLETAPSGSQDSHWPVA